MEPFLKHVLAVVLKQVLELIGSEIPISARNDRKDLTISQVNNKYLRKSLMAHLADRQVVHHLLEKENSFQVWGQEERDPGSKALILNRLNRFTQLNAVMPKGLMQQSSEDHKLLDTPQLCPLQSCSSNEGELQDFALEVKLTME